MKKLNKEIASKQPKYIGAVKENNNGDKRKIDE